jgi:eukaryotic-like serine/threonine-protein kinase
MLDERFRLLDRLAEGGMGAVWRGRNVSLDSPVAIKIMRQDLVLRPMLVQRMIDEARAAARLEHPAIVRIIDVRRHERGAPYIVMELLEGQTLAEAMDARGSVAADRAVRCVLPIAGALAFAHDVHGIIHRDVKPENIILAETPGGVLQPKLIDFGMAKAVFGGTTTTTGIGTALGTPRYMSPEQAQGCVATHAVDVWAFCVVLYELIAGRAPFEADSLAELIDAICAQTPEKLEGVRGCDATLWAIIERGLAKGPGDRWASMKQLGEELADWLLARGVTHDVTGRPVADSWTTAPPAGLPRDAFASDPPRAPSSVVPLSVTPMSVPPASPRTQPLPDSIADSAPPGRSQSEMPRRSRWSEVDFAVVEAAAKIPAPPKSNRPRMEKLPFVTTDPSPHHAAPRADAGAHVRAALDAAHKAFTDGKKERAYELCARALDGATTVDAEKHISGDWEKVERILYEGLGGPKARIEVGSLWGWSLSPAEAFVASRIDKLMLAEAIDATGVDPKTALRTISWLHRLGLVRTNP